MTGHSDWVTCLSANNNVKAFVSGSLDSSVKVWDINSGKCVNSIPMKSPVWGVAFSPSGEHLVTATQDGTITLIAL